VCVRTLTLIGFVLKCVHLGSILCIRMHEHAKEPSELVTPILLLLLLLLCLKPYF